MSFTTVVVFNFVVNVVLILVYVVAGNFVVVVLIVVVDHIVYKCGQ